MAVGIPPTPGVPDATDVPTAVDASMADTPSIDRATVDPALARSLPNLIVIGAMKCGTSSFHEYLDAHPSIQMSKPKELDFFLPGQRGSWSKGVAWYAGQFDASSAVRGEASPNYTKWPSYGGVPERMHALLPDAKLIYLVRDPIERILSHYLHAVTAGREKRSLDDALANLDPNWYVTCSRYAMQAQRFLERYQRAQLLILAAEDLRRDTTAVMAEAYRFLGVDSAFTSPRFGKVRNAMRHRGEPTRLARLLDPVLPARYSSGLRALPLAGRTLYRRVAKPVVSDALRGRLQEVLAEDVAALRAMTRLDFASWSM